MKWRVTWSYAWTPSAESWVKIPIQSSTSKSLKINKLVPKTDNFLARKRKRRRHIWLCNLPTNRITPTILEVSATRSSFEANWMWQADFEEEEDDVDLFKHHCVLSVPFPSASSRRCSSWALATPLSSAQCGWPQSCFSTAVSRKISVIFLKFRQSTTVICRCFSMERCGVRQPQFS